MIVSVIAPEIDKTVCTVECLESKMSVTSKLHIIVLAGNLVAILLDTWVKHSVNPYGIFVVIVMKPVVKGILPP